MIFIAVLHNPFNNSCLNRFLLLSLLCIAFSCTKKAADDSAPAFSFEAPVGRPVTPVINETSGIADSKKNPGHLWVQEDSGNPPQLILLRHSGEVLKNIYLKNAVNRDWEDMVLAGSQLYIADIGDNNQEHSSYTIYVLDEPLASADTITAFTTIRFQYPDGAHDAEALLVDADKSIFIITKRDNPSRIYKIPFPYSFSELNTAIEVGRLSLSDVVSAAMSANGNHVLLKTYTEVFHYPRKNTADDIAAILSGTPEKVNYRLEPQGEALTFAQDDSGFFTLSEKGRASNVQLYFYKKK